MATTKFTPRPAPGELIRSDWMNTLADAVGDLQDYAQKLEKRIVDLEKNVGKPTGGGGKLKVEWEREKLDEVVELTKKKLEKVEDPADKLKLIYVQLQKNRKEIIVDNPLGDPRPDELAVFLHELGMPVTDQLAVMDEVAPSLALELKQTFEEAGTNAFSFDAGSGLFNFNIG